MEKLVLIIGGNLGERELLLHQTNNLLADYFGDPELKSKVYETAAWGGKSTGLYLNQVLVYSTDAEPRQVLKNIQKIENLLGRQREVKWGDRTMDIDILYYGDRMLDSPEIQIPHPFLSKRRFVLTPLAEVLPDYLHPLLKKTNTELLEDCQDDSFVYVYEKSPE